MCREPIGGKTHGGRVFKCMPLSRNDEVTRCQNRWLERSSFLKLVLSLVQAFLSCYRTEAILLFCLWHLSAHLFWKQILNFICWQPVLYLFLIYLLIQHSLIQDLLELSKQSNDSLKSLFYSLDSLNEKRMCNTSLLSAVTLS